jgi:hypothetical protein
MSTSVAGDFETPRPSHRGGAKKAVIVVAKLLVTGVLLADRGVGVGLLIVLGFVVLLFPSGLTALGGYRDVVLVVYGALILAGALGLLLVPKTGIGVPTRVSVFLARPSRSAAPK